MSDGSLMQEVACAAPWLPALDCFSLRWTNETDSVPPSGHAVLRDGFMFWRSKLYSEKQAAMIDRGDARELRCDKWQRRRSGCWRLPSGVPA